MDVLVTDGADKKSLAVIHAIREDVDVIGSVSRFPFSMAATSKYTDRSHVIGPDDAEEYVTRLVSILECYGYDYVLPISGRTTEILAFDRERIPVPIDPILPPRESLRVALDKHEVHSLADELGVPTPTTVELESADDFRPAIAEAGTPGVIKASNETEGKFIEYVSSVDELRSAYEVYHRNHESTPIYQEYLAGRGRGFFGLYLDGTCRGHYSHRRIREDPPTGGKSACAESLIDAELYGYSSSLLDALDWNGVVMVEFKNDADGVPHVVEINPKLWGSIELGVKSGMNFPRALLQYLSSGTVPSFEFTPARFHWPISGDIQHAIRRPESASEIVRDVVSPSTKSNLRFTDPLPHVSEVGKAVISEFY